MPPSWADGLNCTQWTCSTHVVKLQMHPTIHIEYEFVSIKHLCLVVLHLTLEIRLCLYMFTVSIYFQLSREPVTHTVWNHRCIQTSSFMLKRVQVDLIVVLHIGFDTIYLYEFKLIWLWCYTSDPTHSIFMQNTGMCRCTSPSNNSYSTPPEYDLLSSRP